MVYFVPQVMTRYDQLVKSGFNVFNVDDLVAIWSMSDRRDALESIKGYVKRGKIISVFKGIYALEKDYSKFELGQKLFTPAYVSYYSALAFHGIIFQQYEDIHLFAVNSKLLIIDDQKYIYHKVKNEVLNNDTDILNENHYAIASAERAICDSLYLNRTIAFDNLRGVDTQKLERISKIYNNKRLITDIQNLIKHINIE